MDNILLNILSVFYNTCVFWKKKKSHFINPYLFVQTLKYRLNKLWPCYVRPNVLLNLFPNFYSPLSLRTTSVCMCSVAQLCPTLCDSWTGLSVHEIFLARILECVAISSSRVSSWSRDWAHVSCISCIVGRFFAAHPLINQFLQWAGSR